MHTYRIVVTLTDDTQAAIDALSHSLDRVEDVDSYSFEDDWAGEIDDEPAEGAD